MVCYFPLFSIATFQALDTVSRLLPFLQYDLFIALSGMRNADHLIEMQARFLVGSMLSCELR